MVTPRQRECYRAIATFSRENGRFPRYSDIGEQLGISRQAVSKLVRVLVAEGFVVVPARRVNPLELVHPGPEE